MMAKHSSSDLLRLETENNGFSPSFLLKPELTNKRTDSGNRTFKVEASSVLGNVKVFLPKMAAANSDLQKTLESVPASTVDIENTDNCAGDIIEMLYQRKNLKLYEEWICVGIFSGISDDTYCSFLKQDQMIKIHNLALIEHGDSHEEDSSESGCELDDSDSEVSDSDSDSDPQVNAAGSLGDLTEDTLKISQKSNQKKPKIEVISDDSEVSSDSGSDPQVNAAGSFGDLTEDTLKISQKSNQKKPKIEVISDDFEVSSASDSDPQVNSAGSFGDLTEDTLKISQKSNQKKPKIEVISEAKSDALDMPIKDFSNKTDNSPG